MNAWAYLDAHPVAAVVLVVVLAWSLRCVLRAWRDRRPAVVRVVLVCPVCERGEAIDAEAL